MTRFVIISQARSGSTMLGTAIAGHPQVLMHGEIFGAGHFPLNFYGIDDNLPWPTPLESYLKQMRDVDPAGFLERMVFADTARVAVGLKFKFEEFSIWPSVCEFIRMNNLPIIYVRRKSLVNRYLSEVEALFTGLFNSTDKTTYGPISEEALRGKLTLSSVSGALDLSAQYEKDFKLFFEANTVLELIFEDVISNWTAASHRICEFLGLVGMELQPETARQPQQRQIDAYFDRTALMQSLSAGGYNYAL